MELQPSESTVLVVDDTPANLHLLAQLLTHYGCKVRVVNNGAQAIESALTNPPDLIMLDVMMPGLDGYETCQRLKAEPSTREIPIIFISALASVEDKVRAFAAGGVDYVTKPFHAAEVIARVETHLALRQARRQLEEQNNQFKQEILERQRTHRALTALNAVAAAASNSLDLEADLEHALKIVLQELQLDYAWLFIPENGGRLLRLVVSLGLPAQFRRQEILRPVDHCDCGELMVTGRSLRYFDRPVCVRLAAYQEGFPELPAQHLSLPILAKQRVVGILNLAGANIAGLTAYHYEWLEAVAGQIGNAIENALLYQNVLNKAERLSVLHRLSTILSQSWQLDQVLPPLLSEVAQVVDTSLGVIVLRSDDSREPYKAHFRFGRWQNPAALNSITWQEAPFLPIIEQTRAPLFIRDPAGDNRLNPLAGLVEQENIQTMLILPMVAHNQLSGFIQLGVVGRPRTFEATEVELARTLTNQAAVAVEKARLYEATVTRYEQEQEIARQIQQNLLPQAAPHLPGFSLAGLCRPAYMTGGDFYDFIPLPTGPVGIVVGDVTGKSLPAALVMALARNTIRLELVNHLRPAVAMTAANRWLCRDIRHGTFVATVQALIDPATRQMSLVNAGQMMAFLVRDGQVSFVLPLDSAAIPLGLEEDLAYTQSEVALLPGDSLVFYTDGIVEARNKAGHMFGFERLEAGLQGLAGRNPEEMIAGLMAAVEAFVEAAEQHDDMTIVVVQVTGE